MIAFVPEPHAHQRFVQRQTERFQFALIGSNDFGHTDTVHSSSSRTSRPRTLLELGSLSSTEDTRINATPMRPGQPNPSQRAHFR